MDKERQSGGRIYEGGTCAFIKLDSVMDLGKAAQLEKEFEEIVLNGKRKIYLDFSDVDFLCSYMMRVLLKFRKIWGRAGVKMGIQELNDYSRNSLKMSGLADLFTLSSQWHEECGILDDENLNLLEN